MKRREYEEEGDKVKQTTRISRRKERLEVQAKDKERRISAGAILQEAERKEQEAAKAVEKMLEEELTQLELAEEKVSAARAEKEEAERRARAEKRTRDARERAERRRHFEECLGAQATIAKRVMLGAFVMTVLNVAAIPVILTLDVPFYVLVAVAISAWEWLAVVIIAFLVLTIWKIMWRRRGYDVESFDAKDANKITN